MQTIDHLIYAKWLITCEDNNKVLNDHALAIKDGKILDILPDNDAKNKYQAKETHQYKDHAIAPGFINCHTHIAMNTLRGFADDLPLLDWLKNFIWPAEGKWVSHDFVYDGSQLAIAEMIRCGTTCFNDMYFYVGATVKAAQQAGIRAHLGLTIMDIPTGWAQTTEEYFAKAEQVYQEYKDADLITLTMAPQSTYTVTLENLSKVRDWANKYSIKTNIHLHESASDIAEFYKTHKKRPIESLNEMNFVNDNLIAIHMANLNDKDLDVLAKQKPNIVHCPESNMKLASGIAPVQKLLDFGVNVALGTDGAASNNDLDMITEMRSAAFLGKISTMDPCAVSAETALKMATINGARALGIDKETGSLTKGKSADFFAIDLSDIETQPMYNPISAIVYAASRQQVTDTWICGRQVMHNRKLLTLDEAAIKEKTHLWHDKIKAQTVTA